MAVFVGRANKPRRARALKLRGDMGGISGQYKVCLIYESLVVKTVGYCLQILKLEQLTD